MSWRPLLLVIFLLSAGCTTAPNDDSAGAASEPVRAEAADTIEEDDAADGSEPLHWSAQAEVPIRITAGAGVPFVQYAVEGECDTYAWQLQGNVTRLDVRLKADEQAGGAGWATFMLRNGQEEWRKQDQISQGEVAMSVESPSSGRWVAWVWPSGPVVDRVFLLQVDIEGEGAPQELDLVPTDPC